MSGKQNKRELKRQKAAEREAARRRERRQSLITAGIVAGILAIGGVLIFFSLEDSGDPAAEPTDAPTEESTAPPENAPPADPAEDERDVACGGEIPPGAGEPREVYEAPEQVLSDGVDYTAVVETSCGTITMDLNEQQSPETVNSFVFLAQQGFFDGLEIFRNATSIGALQTGAGNNTASWDVGYTLPDELELAEGEGYPVGSVAMANAGPDTGGSQFFFVYNDTFDEAFADNRAYARFARVTEGLEVLEEIGAVAADGETPTEQIWIERVTIFADDEPLAPAAAPPGGATEAPTAEPTDAATEPAATEPATDPTEG